MGAVTARRPTVQRIDDPDEEAPDVRLAEQRDVPRIAATLTVALADSRWTRWALPDDGRMQRLTRLHELDAGAPRRRDAERVGHRGRRRRRRLGAARRDRSPARRRVRGAGPRAAPTWRPTAGRRPRHRRAGRRAPGRPSRTGGWPHLGVRPTSRRRGPGGGGARAGAACAATPRARPPRPRCSAGRTCASCAASASRSPPSCGRRTTSSRSGCWCGSLCPAEAFFRGPVDPGRHRSYRG